MEMGMEMQNGDRTLVSISIWWRWEWRWIWMEIGYEWIGMEMSMEMQNGDRKWGWRWREIKDKISISIPISCLHFAFPSPSAPNRSLSIPIAISIPTRWKWRWSPNGDQSPNWNRANMYLIWIQFEMCARLLLLRFRGEKVCATKIFFPFSDQKLFWHYSTLYRRDLYHYIRIEHVLKSVFYGKSCHFMGSPNNAK